MASKSLSIEQRMAVPGIILHRLKHGGKTIDELGSRHHAGDKRQLPYGDRPVWHKKSDLDEWVAGQLHLPPSLWGEGRKSDDLRITTSRELIKLRKKGIIADWSSKKRTTLMRLEDPDIPVSAPVVGMSRSQGVPPPEVDMSMKTAFLSIISKGKKDNTYKFALGKTILDYCKNNPATGRTSEIPYDYLAGEFLKHYWYQKYRFRMKQDFHTKKTPVVMQILEDTFGEKPPQKFKRLSQDDLRIARKKILENIFGPAKKKKGMVVQRFQKIVVGKTTRDTNIFYDYDDEEKKIFLRPEAHDFFRQNYGLLTRALLAEWIRYLERVNHGLPMLAAKIDDEEAKRGPLTKYKKAFLEHSGHCFYCNGTLEAGSVHVDHFIPWSYIFDNNAWNLVLACAECNLDKSSALPREPFVEHLIERDYQYSAKMAMMEKSLRRLSIKGRWQDEIHGHYKICHEYGFGTWAG